MTTWYREGLVSLTAGSDLVAGVGTEWVDSVLPGGIFFTPTGLVEVERVISDGSLKLVAPYAGPSVVGAEYAIAPTQGYVVDLAKQVNAVLGTFGELKDAWQAGKLVGKGVALKGVKDDVSDLPATGNASGDGWMVDGHLHVWTGSAWLDQGSTVTSPELEALRDTTVTARNDAVAIAAASMISQTAFEDRVYPGVYSTPPTNKPRSGLPSADGDRCTILVGGAPYEHLRSGGGWLIPNIDAAQLGTGAGTTMVGHKPAGTDTINMTAAEAFSLRYNVWNYLTPAERADAETGTPLIDVSAKINKAIDKALAAKRPLDAFGDFRVGAERIIVKGSADFSGAVFHVYGAPAIACEVSTGSAANPADMVINAVIRLPRSTINKSKPSMGWLGQGIAWRTVNTLSCRIHTGHMSGFKSNLLVTAFNGRGNVYNEYVLGWFDNGQVNLQLRPGDATAWVNENNFYGGRFSHLATEGIAVAGVRQIEILPFDVTNAIATWPDNNMFIKPSIEGEVPEYHAVIGGAWNKFVHARWEASPPRVLFVGHATAQVNQRNEIQGGFKSANIVYSKTGVVYCSGAVAIDGMDLEGSGDVINIMNTSGDGSAFPHVQGFPAGVSPLGKNTASTDFTYRIYANGIIGKRAGETLANARLRVDWINSFIYLGDGASPAVAGVGPVPGGGGALGPSHNWLPYTHGALDLGISSRKWRYAQFTGSAGFFDMAPPPSKPSVVGSRGSNAALGSLLNALASWGIVANDTTP